MVNELFQYHVSNESYRPYVDKAKIDRAVKKINKENSEIEQSNNECAIINNVSQENSRVTRSQLKPLSAPNELREHKCIICGFFYHQGEKQTYRMCHNVFTRCSELQSSKDVFTADIYCHKKCIRLYLKKYEIVGKACSSKKNLH